jgi:N-acetylglutamate synthase-like GNAT family acetyltransferase
VDLEDVTVRRAAAEDTAALAALLAANDMDCSDVPVGEFSVLVDRGEIVSAIRLEDHGDQVVVRPIVVAARHRGEGLGRHLLERVMPRDRPTVLVARGGAVGFYARVGFAKASWECVPAPQHDECRLCPERPVCAPQPMVRHPDPAPGRRDGPGGPQAVRRPQRGEEVVKTLEERS